MTITTLNWDFRNDLHIIKGAALPALLSLILHANGNMRAWPSIKTICKESGYSNQPVIEGLKQLEKISAIVKVPYEKRMELESKLHKRKTIYQLTGMYSVDGEIKFYLLMNSMPSESIESLKTILNNLEFSDNQAKSVISEILDSKSLESKHKGSTVIKGSIEEKDIKDISAKKADSANHDDNPIFADSVDGV
jgi:hypothetical protein